MLRVTISDFDNVVVIPFHFVARDFLFHDDSPLSFFAAVVMYPIKIPLTYTDTFAQWDFVSMEFNVVTIIDF